MRFGTTAALLVISSVAAPAHGQMIGVTLGGGSSGYEEFSSFLSPGLDVQFLDFKVFFLSVSYTGRFDSAEWFRSSCVTPPSVGQDCPNEVFSGNFAWHSVALGPGVNLRLSSAVTTKFRLNASISTISGEYLGEHSGAVIDVSSDQPRLLAGPDLQFQFAFTRNRRMRLALGARVDVMMSGSGGPTLGPSNEPGALWMFYLAWYPFVWTGTADSS